MVDVILASDNVTVLGGPSNLEVDLNIGAPGIRGSLFFVGTQNPNSLNINQDFPQRPAVFDIFINVNASSEDYLQAYQFTNQDGVSTWIPTFNISQNTYTVNKVVEFQNGEAAASIEIAQLGLDAVPFDVALNSFAYFNIQASLTNVDLDDLSATPLPSAMSFKVEDSIFNSNGSFDPGQFPSLLPITFNAVEFDGTDWNPIDGKTTYVCITASFVDPNEIFQSLDFEVSE
jgi:hypothetical protein